MENTKKMTEERLLRRTGVILLALLPGAYILEALNYMDYARMIYGVMFIICVVALVKEFKIIKKS